MEFELVVFYSVLSLSLAAKQPNIVFILADDLGWADVGYAETTDVQTPNIDRIAGRSLRLPHSYTHSVCSPSRAALFTGIYPFRYGLQSHAASPLLPIGLNESLIILPQKLKELGYSTHLVGKWHLGLCKDSFIPTRRGFDTFGGFLSGYISYYTHDRKMARMTVYDFWDNDEVDDCVEYSMHHFANKSERIIKERGSKEPFFLFVSSQAVHEPFELPPANYLKSDQSPRDIYKSMVRELDDLVGRIEHRLKEENLWDDTVFIFTSDNGALPTGGSNFPLRGAKHTFWEGGTRARTFVHYPSLKAGKFDGLFHVVDWFPTILSMAGSSGDLDLDGVDQWPALQNLNKEPPRTSFIYHIEDVTIKGVKRTNAGVRLRQRMSTGLEDFKLIVGSPGKANDWYPIGSTVQPYMMGSQLSFIEGALFNMSEPDALLEKREVIGHHDVRKMMKTLIELEKDKGYQDFIGGERAVPENVFKMDSRGRYILRPGWC